MERPGKLAAGELKNVRTVDEIVEALADVAAMQLSQARIRDVVKRFREEDAFVADVRGRLGEGKGGVDVIRWPPRGIGPVRARLENVVLKIILMKQDEALLVALLGEFAQTIPIPGVEPRQIVATQAIPRGALAGAGKGLLVERRFDLGVCLPDVRVLIATAVVPEAVVVVVSNRAAGVQARR